MLSSCSVQSAVAKQPVRTLLNRSAGLLRGARLSAEAEGLQDVAAALIDLQAAVALLAEAVERRDRQRESAARRRAAGESRAGA